MAFVADNSVTVAWCVGSQANEKSNRLAARIEREAVHAPALWPFEFVNAIWSLERRGNLRAYQAEGAISRIERVNVTVHSEPPPKRELLDIARAAKLSTYDAAYLELARRLGLPLASLDARQLSAARLAGIATI